jgi:hypothetical protein
MRNPSLKRTKTGIFYQAMQPSYNEILKYNYSNRVHNYSFHHNSITFLSHIFFCICNKLRKQIQT